MKLLLHDLLCSWVCICAYSFVQLKVLDFHYSKMKILAHFVFGFEEIYIIRERIKLSLYECFLICCYVSPLCSHTHEIRYENIKLKCGTKSKQTNEDFSSPVGVELQVCREVRKCWETNLHIVAVVPKTFSAGPPFCRTEWSVYIYIGLLVNLTLPPVWEPLYCCFCFFHAFCCQ